ncbi:hypothetical protein V8G54_005872 [Vigna mungo]|uniref:Uncharacterized protein n=1 Tax=Vigna mungo TaxID=3915 RepID=A0AAQ3P019_VIGMU
MELMITVGKTVPKLQLEHGLAVDRVYPGSFMTSLDMAEYPSVFCDNLQKVPMEFLKKLNEDLSSNAVISSSSSGAKWQALLVKALLMMSPTALKHAPDSFVRILLCSHHPCVVGNAKRDVVWKETPGNRGGFKKTLTSSDGLQKTPAISGGFGKTPAIFGSFQNLCYVRWFRKKSLFWMFFRSFLGVFDPSRATVEDVISDILPLMEPEDTIKDDDSTSADDEIREVSKDDEIEEILNQSLLKEKMLEWLRGKRKVESNEVGE